MDKHPVGSLVEGEVKNKTEFGLFIGLDGDVDGMVHLSDLDWNRPGEQVIEEYKKGDYVRAVVLDVDTDKERISLGIKQVGSDPFAGAGDAIRKGAVVTCEVLEVKDGGLEVKISGSDITTFIKRSELARDRGDQRPDRFAAGEKFDARVVLFDKKTRKIQVSVKLSKWPRRRKRWRSMVRPIPGRPSATSSARPSRRASKRQSFGTFGRIRPAGKPAGLFHADGGEERLTVLSPAPITAR